MDIKDDKDFNIDDAKKVAAKKLATGALVVATALGASAAVDNPANYDEFNTQTAIVQDVGDYTFDAVVDEENAEDEQRQKKQVTIGSILLAPFYIAGMGLLKIAELLLAGLKIPILGSIIEWALFACAVVGSIAAALKLAFPEIPLGKLMSPRRIVVLVAGTAVVSIVCELLPLFGAEAATWASWIRLAGGALIIAPMAYVIIKLGRRFQRRSC